jgi:hypothetical protein
LAVPELTRSAGIQLNERVPLQHRATRLASIAASDGAMMRIKFQIAVFWGVAIIAVAGWVWLLAWAAMKLIR